MASVPYLHPILLNVAYVTLYSQVLLLKCIEVIFLFPPMHIYVVYIGLRLVATDIIRACVALFVLLTRSACVEIMWQITLFLSARLSTYSTTGSWRKRATASYRNNVSATHCLWARPIRTASIGMISHQEEAIVTRLLIGPTSGRFPHLSSWSSEGERVVYGA